MQMSLLKANLSLLNHIPVYPVPGLVTDQPPDQPDSIPNLPHLLVRNVNKGPPQGWCGDVLEVGLNQILVYESSLAPCTMHALMFVPTTPGLGRLTLGLSSRT